MSRSLKKLRQRLQNLAARRRRIALCALRTDEEQAELLMLDDFLSPGLCRDTPVERIQPHLALDAWLESVHIDRRRVPRDVYQHMESYFWFGPPTDMVGLRWFPKDRYSKCAAWEELRLTHRGNPWRKAHCEHHWAYTRVRSCPDCGCLAFKQGQVILTATYDYRFRGPTSNVEVRTTEQCARCGHSPEYSRRVLRRYTL